MSTQLDSFQSELLAELQGRVGQSPRRSSRVRGMSIGGGVLAAAAVGVIVAATALAPAPAFAVTEDDQGDIRIVLNSLSDAAGLEAELATRGIDATVTFDQGGVGSDGGGVVVEPQGDAEAHGGATDAQAEETTTESSSGGTSVGAPGADDRFATDCGVTSGSEGPRVTYDDDKAVIVIPDGSIPVGKDLTISTAGDGSSFSSLQVTWAGADGECGVASVSATATVAP